MAETQSGDNSIVDEPIEKPTQRNGSLSKNKTTKLLFSGDVQKAIEQVLRTDPVENPDFNATDYINQLFPTEQSLSTRDAVIFKMENACREIDENIPTVVRDIDGEISTNY